MSSFTTRWSRHPCSRCRDGAELEFSAGKRGGKPSPPQRDISEVLIELARAGRACCGSRAAIPSCSAEAARRPGARHGRRPVPHHVPGITAGLRRPGLPASPRPIATATTVDPGHRPSRATSDDGRRLGGACPTGQPIVIYMADDAASEHRRLAASGRPRSDTPAALIAVGATDEERRWSKAPWEPGRRRGAPSLRRLARDHRHRRYRGGSPPTRPSCGVAGELRDDIRAHRCGAALRRRQDHRHDRLDARAEAAGGGGARRQVRARLYRPGVPRRGDRPAVLISILGRCRRRRSAPSWLAAPRRSPLIEGVMGLFDGVGAGRTARAPPPTSAAVGLAGGAGARRLRPGADAAVAARLRALSIRDVTIAGVILNRVGSERHRGLDRARGFGASACQVIGALATRRHRVAGTPSRPGAGGRARTISTEGSTPSPTAERVDVDHAACARLGRCRRRPAGVAAAWPAHRARRDAAFAFVYPHLLDGWRARRGDRTFLAARR